MCRNEIRLRRQRITARGIDRFRNYNTVLLRHERTQRLKKIIKAFGFFIALLIVVMVILFLSRWEKGPKAKGQQQKSLLLITPEQSADGSKTQEASPLKSHRSIHKIKC